MTSLYHSPKPLQSSENMCLDKRMFVQSTVMIQPCHGISKVKEISVISVKIIFCWKELNPTIISDCKTNMEITSGSLNIP